MIGLDDIVVVDTDDALLVAPRSQAQKVKEAVSSSRSADSPSCSKISPAKVRGESVPG